MKVKRWIIIWLLMSPASICRAADDPTIAQEAIATRLEKLQNLIVKYSYRQTTSLPSELLKRIEEHSEIFIAIGTRTSEKEFSFLEGRARYDSRLKDIKLDVQPPAPLREHEFEVLSYPGDRVERLWRLEGIKVYTGSIGQDKEPILQNDIELGLGMRPWGKQVTWLDPANLEKMEIVLPDENFAIMRNVDEKGWTDEWTFDRRFGYALISYRKLFPPDNRANLEVTAEEFKNVDGLMLPFSIISRILYWKNGKSKVTGEVRIEAHEYKLNDPNNVPERYHIKWPDNTFVVDERSGVIFKYQNGVIQLKDSAHKDAIGDIDKILSESSDRPPRESVSVFIPKAEIALERGEPFVFDIASGKLINPAAKVGSEQAHKNLLKLSKGDIAWDGSLVTVRKAKALTVSQESHRPLKCTPGRWCNWDRLPDKVDLPYSVLVVTNEDVDYLISILEIKSDGMKITYKKLSGDEAKRYYPAQKKSK